MHAALHFRLLLESIDIRVLHEILRSLCAASLAQEKRFKHS